MPFALSFAMHLVRKASVRREMITSRGYCWIATMESNQLICGIGESEREAIQNVIKQICGNGFTPVIFACILCTSEFYNDMGQHGAVGLSWELNEGDVARLVGAISSSEA